MMDMRALCCEMMGFTGFRLFAAPKIYMLTVRKVGHRWGEIQEQEDSIFPIRQPEIITTRSWLQVLRYVQSCVFMDFCLKMSYLVKV